MSSLLALFTTGNVKINLAKFIENKNYNYQNIPKKIFLKSNFFHLLGIVITNKKIYFKYAICLRRLTAYYLTSAHHQLYLKKII